MRTMLRLRSRRPTTRRPISELRRDPRELPLVLREQGLHAPARRSSLIPDDPSLLLTTAGMVQFKPVFLGVQELRVHARHHRAEVRAHDRHRHHRHDRPPPQLLRDARQLQLRRLLQARGHPRGRGSTRSTCSGSIPTASGSSIYEDDDEAEAIWLDEVGVPAERIVRMGAKDNFWSAGPTGPCGPCSELYYDQGPEVGCGGHDCAPGCDCDRYLEYWNLVFMQYDRARGRHARAAAEAEHRHRHGPRAHRRRSCRA